PARDRHPRRRHPHLPPRQRPAHRPRPPITHSIGHKHPSSLRRTKHLHHRHPHTGEETIHSLRQPPTPAHRQMHPVAENLTHLRKRPVIHRPRQPPPSTLLRRPIELHRYIHRRVERPQRVPPRRPRTITLTLIDRLQQPRITHQHRRPKPRHPPQQRPRRDHPHTHPAHHTPHQRSNALDLRQRSIQQRTG